MLVAYGPLSLINHHHHHSDVHRPVTHLTHVWDASASHPGCDPPSVHHHDYHSDVVLTQFLPGLRSRHHWKTYSWFPFKCAA